MSAFRALASEVHKLLQNTEAYAAYAAKVARRYRRNDIAAKWIVAAAACAPFVDKLRTTSADTASWFLALVPLLALGLPLLNFSRVIQLASELHGKHTEILPHLRNIWREISGASEYAPDTVQLVERWKREVHDIDIRLAAIRAKKSEMPEIKSLEREAIRDCEKVQEVVFQDSSKQSDVGPSAKPAETPAAEKTQEPEKRTETRSSSSHSSSSGGAAVISYQTHTKL